MEEIIEKIIEWSAENNMLVDIRFRSEFGGFYCILKLSRGKKKTVNEFYIPGGVFSVEGWKIGDNDLELKMFLEQAKAELN